MRNLEFLTFCNEKKADLLSAIFCLTKKVRNSNFLTSSRFIIKRHNQAKCKYERYLVLSLKAPKNFLSS